MKSRIFIKQNLQKLFSIVLLASFLSGAFSVEAQTRRRAKQPKKTIAEAEKKVCLNCWSGKVSYIKKFEDKHNSNEPVFGTLQPAQERVTHDYTRNSEYTAEIVVDGSSGNPRADIQINYDEREMDNSSVTEFTRCHNFEEDRLITESSEMKRITGAQKTASGENFNVSVYDEKFNFGIRLPDTSGKYYGKTQSRAKISVPIRPENLRKHPKIRATAELSARQSVWKAK